MTQAHDVFAETNPAFCAYVLAAFAAAFCAADDRGPELPAVYLSLPIALSGDLDSTFDQTNKKTGLFEWLERKPEIRVGLAERVNGSLAIVTEAVRLACFADLLVLGEGARLKLGSRKVRKFSKKKLSAGIRRTLGRAEKLGYWYAAAGSTTTVFNMMELTV